jgi:hypothetical protein
MRSTKVNRNDRLRTTGAVESSSWWPFVAIVLGALGCYGLLVVHLILDATNAGAWGLAWMGVPMVFLAGSVGAVLIASGMPARERLAAIRAAFFGYSPRERSRLPSTPPTRERA